MLRLYNGGKGALQFGGVTIESGESITIVRTSGGWEIKLREGEEAVITPPKEPLPSFLNKPRVFDKSVFEAGAKPFSVASWDGRGP